MEECLVQVHRLRTIRAVALDLDGVVYLGNHPLPGAVAAVQQLRDMGMAVYFLTNNSGKTRSEIAAKLAAIGIPAEAEDCLSSGYAASVLVHRFAQQELIQVMVLGSDSLKAEIAHPQVRLVADGPCHFLVVGFCPDFGYQDVTMGMQALWTGAKLIICNRDAYFPTMNNRFLPGCGALVAAIEYVSGRKSDYEVGKPSAFLLQLLAAENGVRPEEILIVGDVLSSDIAMANRFGSPSILITGTSSTLPEQVRLQETDCSALPDLELITLSDLPPLLHALRS